MGKACCKCFKTKLDTLETCNKYIIYFNSFLLLKLLYLDKANVSETHTRKDSSKNSEDENNVKDKIKEALREKNNEEEKESKVISLRLKII